MAGDQMKRGEALDGALETLALDAVGADVEPLGLAVDASADTLNIRVETAIRAHVRVRNRLAELRALTANIANRGHGALLNSSKP